MLINILRQVYMVMEGTFTMFTSKRTQSVLEPKASNTSSAISPVGSAFAGDGEGGGGAKSRGIGGRFFVSVRAVVSSWLLVVTSFACGSALIV